jgi:protein SCO1/2
MAPLMLLLASWLAAASPAPADAAAALKAGAFEPPRPAPDFTLQGSDGSALRLSRYRGKVVLLGFGFTTCPAVCPITLLTLAQARKRLGADAADVQVVYVTVDPERDTAEQMKHYLGAFDPSFVGGTGSEDDLAAVRKEYGIAVEKQAAGGSYLYAHSSFVYLIDREGLIRALMPYGHEAEDYVHDVRILLGRQR